MRYALALLILGAFLPATSAGAKPLERVTATAACVGVPAPVNVQRDGSGVRAGRVTISCAGAWRVFQAVLWYQPANGQVAGKWTYGGTRYVSGRGDTVIPHWDRPYHGCGWWKQRVITAEATRDSSVEWFCA